MFVKKYYCCKYEWFMQSPVKHCEQLANELEIEFSVRDAEALLGKKIPVGHVVGGNRMTKEADFQIKNSSSTKRNPSMVTRLICFLVCRPVMMLANYACKKSFHLPNKV